MVRDSRPPRGDRSPRGQLSGSLGQWLLFAVGGVLFLGAVLVVAGAPGALLDGPLSGDGDVSPTTPGTETTGNAGDGDGGTAGGSTDTATPTGSTAEVVYRVNAGGPELGAENGPAWSADTGDNPSEHLNARESNTVTNDTPDEITLEDDVPSTAPEEMFETYRFERGADEGDSEEMVWTFSVDPDREYEVRIYGMEAYFTDGDEGREYEKSYQEHGPRSFGIAIDDEVVLENHEPFRAHGHDVGAVHAYRVTPDDDTLTIRFIHEENTPTVSGIEIVATGEGSGDD